MEQKWVLVHAISTGLLITLTLVD